MKLFISAFRSNLNLYQNTQRTERLCAFLVASKQHFEVCTGFYPEEGSQCVTAETTLVVSTFEKGAAEVYALYMHNEYQQDCIGVLDEHTGDFGLMFPDAIYKPLGKWTRVEQQPRCACTFINGGWYVAMPEEVDA